MENKQVKAQKNKTLKLISSPAESLEQTTRSVKNTLFFFKSCPTHDQGKYPEYIYRGKQNKTKKARKNYCLAYFNFTVDFECY